jgi:flagellar hook-basal body complex protein FliE
MIERINSQANIESMLQTLRSVQAQASADLPTPAAVAGQSERIQAPHFGDLIKNAVEQVNVAQTETRELQAAYERGANIPLTDVVLSMQKSSLAFETTLQIRNKVMRAYEDILSMPV